MSHQREKSGWTGPIVLLVIGMFCLCAGYDNQTHGLATNTRNAGPLVLGYLFIGIGVLGLLLTAGERFTDYLRQHRAISARRRAERNAKDEEQRRIDAARAKEKQDRADQKRREDARAACQLLYLRNNRFLKERLPRDDFDFFVKTYMDDGRSADYVEARGREISKTIEDLLACKLKASEDREHWKQTQVDMEKRLRTEKESVAEQLHRLEAERQRLEALRDQLNEDERARASRPPARGLDPDEV